MMLLLVLCESHGVKILPNGQDRLPTCIVFFDEIDSMASARGGQGEGGGEGFGMRESPDRMLSQLLTEMDGIQELQGVVVIAATNRVDMIDAAITKTWKI